MLALVGISRKLLGVGRSREKTRSEKKLGGRAGRNFRTSLISCIKSFRHILCSVEACQRMLGLCVAVFAFRVHWMKITG